MRHSDLGVTRVHGSHWSLGFSECWRHLGLSPCSRALGPSPDRFFSVSYVGLFATTTWRLGEGRSWLGCEGWTISNPVTMDGACRL